MGWDLTGNIKGPQGIQGPSGVVSATAPVVFVDGVVSLDPIATAKILDDAVTYAKMQNISARNRILARTSAGAGNPEELDVPVSTVVGRTATGNLAALTKDELRAILGPVVFVIHGGTAGTARPAGTTAILVIWIGSVEPTNWIDNDIWINTA